MKVIYSIFGIFVGIFILGSNFDDLSKLINRCIDAIGLIIILKSIEIISKWLRKILGTEPLDNLLKTNIKTNNKVMVSMVFGVLLIATSFVAVDFVGLIYGLIFVVYLEYS